MYLIIVYCFLECVHVELDIVLDHGVTGRLRGADASSVRLEVDIPVDMARYASINHESVQAIDLHVGIEFVCGVRTGVMRLAYDDKRDLELGIPLCSAVQKGFSIARAIAGSSVFKTVSY